MQDRFPHDAQSVPRSEPADALWRLAAYHMMPTYQTLAAPASCGLAMALHGWLRRVEGGDEEPW